MKSAAGVSLVCPECGANVVHRTPTGDTMLRGRGLVLKADSLALVCPRCKSDVPLSQTATKAVQDCAVLFFRRDR
jgi:endogenous inhibitor of DNA gyrase (YacG/DUF329 family)